MYFPSLLKEILSWSIENQFSDHFSTLTISCGVFASILIQIIFMLKHTYSKEKMGEEGQQQFFEMTVADSQKQSEGDNSEQSSKKPIIETPSLISHED